MSHFSVHLSPRSVTGVVRPFPLAMQHFYSFASQVCHCWCPPFSAADATFLFVCLPGLSLVVSALFRCFYSFVSHVCHAPRSISIHLSPRPVTGGVRPFPLFLFICSQVCHCWCPPFSVGLVAFLFICLPGLSLPVSAGHAAFLFISQVCHCWCPPLSIGHAAFLFMCPPGLSLVVSATM